MTEELPDDLMMPSSCPACHVDITIPAEEVVLASIGRRPITCPHCHGAKLAISDLSDVAFFSLAEWDAWDDQDPTSTMPEHYHIRAVVEVQEVIILPPMSMN